MLDNMETKIRLTSILQCPERGIVVFALLFCFALLSSLILIANPGFFSHDELAVADIVSRDGLSYFLSTYGRLQPGDHFGVPVRPVSFSIQGIVSLFLPTYPFVVHLADVLMHALVASMLFEVTRRISGNRQLAWLGAIIFLINPLSTFSVGWAAALMDRLYILFGLIALVAAHSYISNKRGYFALFVIFVASTLAMLSKETALILPAALIIYPIFSLESIRSKRLWIAFLVWSTPILLFLLYRAPALLNSFSGSTATPYSVSLANLPEGVLIYFIYPFLPFLTEARSWVLQPSISIWAAVVAHLVLLLLLWRAFSYKLVLAYLAGYLFFLLPILPISMKGAHYLYGSGLVFSLAIAALLTFDWKSDHKILIIIPIGLLAVALLHALVIQVYFYKTGSCMNRTMSTIENMYLSDGGPENMTFIVEPDAPGQVLHRFAHGRDGVGSFYPITFQVIDWDKRHEVKIDYFFNSDCLVYKGPQVYKQPDIDLKVINWGPRSTVINTIPNQQQDGNGGIWFRISTSLALDDLQVLFSGRPAMTTHAQPKLITAVFAPEYVSQISKIEISILQISTGKIFPVGTFNVEASE